MQSINKQLFLNVTIDGPDKRHLDVDSHGIGSIWIIEDVSQLVPVCTLVYSETYSEFSELFPLLGNETMTVDLGLSKDKYRIFKFAYSSYETRSIGALLVRNKEIVTNWIDSDFTKLREYPKVMHYTQTAVSDIVKTITAGLPIEIDSSKGSNDYFINNNVLGETLKDLAQEAISADGSTFMFFKNNCKYKFKTRNSLMRQNTKASFIHGYDLTQFSIFGNDRSLWTNPESNIIGYSYEKGENFTVDKPVATVKKGKASFGKSVPFGQGTDITARTQYEGTRHLHKAEALATGATEGFMDSALRMTFVALGQPFVSCGDVVEVSVAPSLKQLGKQNMMISGKWFVEKIVHHVAKFNYMIKIFCSKANTDFSRRKAVL